MIKLFLNIFFLSITLSLFSQNSSYSKKRMEDYKKAQEAKNKTKNSSNSIPESTNTEVKNTKERNLKTIPSKTKTYTKEYKSKINTSSNIESNNNRSFFSTQLDFTGNPTYQLNNETLYSLFGTLSLNFNITKNFYVGPYFQSQILSNYDNQERTIDSRTVNMSSTKYMGGGITLGFDLLPQKSIEISPEVKAGYNVLNITGIGFDGDSNKTDFINHKILTVNPRLNIGLKLSDYTFLGINGGYSFPFFVSGQEEKAFILKTMSGGLFLRFYLAK